MEKEKWLSIKKSDKFISATQDKYRKPISSSRYLGKSNLCEDEVYQPFAKQIMQHI